MGLGDERNVIFNGRGRSLDAVFGMGRTMGRLYGMGQVYHTPESRNSVDCLLLSVLDLAAQMLSIDRFSFRLPV